MKTATAAGPFDDSRQKRADYFLVSFFASNLQ